MPITITCHGCGQRFRAKESLAGRTTPCPACGAALVIGSAQDAAAEMLLDDAAGEQALAVVAVPMALHGLYDTLLKKEMNALALGVAVMSFGFLAFQISRLRGVDDAVASDEMLREYQRRRRAMG